MTPLELVQQAVADSRALKRNGLRLRELSPDEESARWLVETYHTSEVEPWRSAFLLGCVRHDMGYDTAKEILLGNFRQSSESYAGEAMYFIRGTRAYEDLRHIMLSNPDLHARRGAAAGLACFQSPVVVPDFLEAFWQHKLWPGDIDQKVAKCHPSDLQLLPLLRAEEERQQKLVLHIIDHLVASENAQHWPGEEVRSEVARLLQSPVFRPKRKYMLRLHQWIEGPAEA